MKAFLACISACVLSVALPAHAQVMISEIMYDLEGSDTDREWIEVYNEGEAVDFTEWKLVEGTTNHSLTALGASELTSGTYAVIVDNVDKFKADWPSYNGLLFDSSFSLNNSGEKLGLRCCKKELSDKDSIVFSSDMGAVGDGASLSRSGSTFVPTDATPGAAPGSTRAATPKEEPKPANTPKLPEPKAAPVPEPAPVLAEPRPEPEPAVTVPNEPAPTAIAAVVPEKSKKSVSQKQAPELEPVSEPKQDVKEEQSATVPTSPQVAAVSGAVGGNSKSWWLAAFVIALAGGAATYLVRRSQRKQWKVEESA